jgi:molybdopterin-dependent oxidoreductase alpha subunit
VANIQEIVNLMLLRGQLGKPGAGLCPVRGHSNVQGDRTMGIWERPTEKFLDDLGREFGFEPPRKHGLDTVHAIQAMHGGQAKVFFGLGGNFLSATPDTVYTAEALRRCSLTVQVSTKLNRAHLIKGKQALILPCLGRTEIDEQQSGPQMLTTENSMSVVEGWQGRLAPASNDLLSEPAIVAGMAKAVLGDRTRVDWEGLLANYDRIREHIEHVVPDFEDYNQRARQPGGFYLPNPIRKLKFNTEDGRAHFTVHELPRHNLEPGQFLMMTMRSHDQFNTTIYGLDDRYRGIRNGRRVVFLNPDDIRVGGFHDGQTVDLVSHFEGEERIAHRFTIVSYSIPRRCAATYYPETNVLVAVRSFADKSNTPVSKSVVISITASVPKVDLHDR